METTSKEAGIMTVQDFFPVWDRLEPDQQARLLASARPRTVIRGTVELLDQARLRRLGEADGA